MRFFWWQCWRYVVNVSGCELKKCRFKIFLLVKYDDRATCWSWAYLTGKQGRMLNPPPLHHEFEILANSFEHWPNMCLIYPRSVCGLPEYFMKTSRKRHILLNNDEISFFFPRVTCPYLCCYKEIVSRYYVIPFVQIRQKNEQKITPGKLGFRWRRAHFLFKMGFLKQYTIFMKFSTIIVSWNITQVYNSTILLFHHAHATLDWNIQTFRS